MNCYSPKIFLHEYWPRTAYGQCPLPTQSYNCRNPISAKSAVHPQCSRGTTLKHPRLRDIKINSTQNKSVKSGSQFHVVLRELNQGVDAQVYLITSSHRWLHVHTLFFRAVSLSDQYFAVRWQGFAFHCSFF